MKSLARFSLFAFLAAVAHAQVGANILITDTWAQGSGPAATSMTFLRGTSPTGPFTVTVGSTPVNGSGNYTFVDKPSATNVLVGGTTYYYVAYVSLGSQQSANSAVSNGVLYPLALAAPGVPVAAPQ